MQVRKRTFNLRALSIKRDLFFRKLCQISSHPMDLLDLWECCKCDLVRRCLQNSLCLCRGFANCGGSPGEESLPCSTNCCLMLGPACFWEEEVVSGRKFLRGEWLGFLRALAMLWQAPLTLVKTVSRASACWEQPCRENVSLKRCLLYIPYVFLQIQHMGARGSYLGPSPGSGL